MIVFLLLAFILRVESNCLCLSETTPCTGTSATTVLTNKSATFTFSCNGRACVCGTFAHKFDYWVVPIDDTGAPAPNVILESTTPAGINNGIMVNPSFWSSRAIGMKQGLLKCMDTLNGHGVYNPTLNLMEPGSLPYTASVNDSIIKTVYRSVDCGTSSVAGCCADMYAVLTVLDKVPFKNGLQLLRPPYVRGSNNEKPLIDVVSGFNYSHLPQFLRVNNLKYKVPYGKITKHWAPLFYDLANNWNADASRAFPPLQSEAGEYSADVAMNWYQDILSVLDTTDMNTNAAKRVAIYALLQRASDIYHAYRYTNARWPSGAGQGAGRHSPLMLYGALTTDPDAAAFVKDEVKWYDFHEGKQLNSYVLGPGLGSGEVLWGDIYSDQIDFPDSPDMSHWLPNADYEAIYWQRMLRYHHQPSCGNFSDGRSDSDPYGYIDGPIANGPGSYYFLCCSAGNFIAYALLMHLIPRMQYMANEMDILRFADRYMGFNRSDGFTGGVWAAPDPCAPVDPTEPCSCNPHAQVNGKAHTCKQYGVTWGADPKNPGQCIKHGGNSYTMGRFPGLHGSKPKLARFPPNAQDLWWAYRFCSSNCSCRGMRLDMCDFVLPVQQPTTTTTTTSTISGAASGTLSGSSTSLSSSSSVADTTIVEVITKEAISTADADDESDPLFWLWIALGIALVVCLLFSALILYLRRKSNATRGSSSSAHSRRFSGRGGRRSRSGSSGAKWRNSQRSSQRHSFINRTSAVNPISPSRIIGGAQATPFVRAPQSSNFAQQQDGTQYLQRQ